MLKAVNTTGKRMGTALICLSLWAATARTAAAQETSAAPFEPSHREGSFEMALQGTGVKTMVFFKAFAAAFYMNPEDGRNPLDEVAKRIEVEYFVRIPAKKLSDYTVERMKVNVLEDELAQIRDEIEMMRQYFVDLKPGDRFALTFIPGEGTKFAYNGRLTGVIEGDLFARALFSVWIGERPFDERLKRQILGRDRKEPS